MGWLLLGAIVGLLAFAAAYDAVARRRGTYRPPAAWQGAHERRKERGPLRRLRGAGPHQPPPQ
jgi:hypothetical protein